MKKILILISTILFSISAKTQNLTLDNLLKVRIMETSNFNTFLSPKGWESLGMTEDEEKGTENFGYMYSDKTLIIQVGIERVVMYTYSGKGNESVLINRAKQLKFIQTKKTNKDGAKVNLGIYKGLKEVLIFTSVYNEEYDVIRYNLMVFSKAAYNKSMKKQFEGI